VAGIDNIPPHRYFASKRHTIQRDPIIYNDEIDQITRDHGLQLERQGSSESVQARSSAGPLTL
jgi:hypothetical protein